MCIHWRLCFCGDEFRLGVISINVGVYWNGAFDRCNLKTVKFPNGLQYIGSQAFNNNSLEEVRFPASVLRVGSDAFYGNHSIKNVYAYVVEPLELDQNTFEGQVFQNATLHVPETRLGIIIGIRNGLNSGRWWSSTNLTSTST